MNNIRLFQVVAGLFCIALGIAVFRVHADQEFIHLTPSEGSEFLVSLKSDMTFEQTFVSQGQAISKVGAYFIPVNPKVKDSSGLIHIQLVQQGEVKASGDIPVSRVDGESASLIRVFPALHTSKGESLTMRISANPEVSGFVALQKRMFDESFPDRDISFAINGVKQDYPVAYSVFETIWPPFVQQVGGLLGIAGILLLFWNIAMSTRNTTALLVLVAVAMLYAIPSLGAYKIFLPVVVLLLLATWAILRVSGRTILASLFGAFLFGCSTWLPLYFITGGVVDGMLPIRDALIDPNQISVSHGAGGYVGIGGALFAAVGLLVWTSMMLRKRFTPTQLDTAMVIVFAVGMIISFIPSSFQNSRAIIVVVACIAWFASLAFDKMERFLGTRDIFVKILLALVLVLSLLDLMHITAGTFAYGLGI